MTQEPVDDLGNQWRTAVMSLEHSVSPRQYGYLVLSKAQGLVGSTLLVSVINDLTREVLQTQLRDQLGASLKHVFGRAIQCAFVVDPSIEPLQRDHASEDDVAVPVRGSAPAAPQAPRPGQSGSARDAAREVARELAEQRREQGYAPEYGQGYGGDYAQESFPQGEYRGADYGQEFAGNDFPPEYSPGEFVPGGDYPDLGESEPGRFSGEPSDGAPQESAESGVGRGGQAKPSAPMPAPPSNSQEFGRLNPRYVFESFVTGASNRFAHAAAFAVAEAPAKAYNPLFIYGGSGLGKTHLLHAIGHYARSLYNGIRVRYVNSEEFTNDFINSIKDDEGSSFKHLYRNVDILLIDDIQFLANKEGTQEEFFHTFNALHNHNKQIVITSDLPPKQLSGFEDRLRSRFEWGLITDVQPPELETRIAILRKKAIAEGLKVPEDVLEYIASRISSNIRELEGALIRVTAFASLTRQPVDVHLAEQVLKDLITDEGAESITVAQILHETAEYFELTVDQLCAKSRKKNLVDARQIAMYLCRELTDKSLPDIGDAVGGRDHTTVIHATRKISGLMAERRQIFDQVTELTNRIKQGQRRG